MNTTEILSLTITFHTTMFCSCRMLMRGRIEKNRIEQRVPLLSLHVTFNNLQYKKFKYIKWIKVPSAYYCNNITVKVAVEGQGQGIEVQFIDGWWVEAVAGSAVVVRPVNIVKRGQWRPIIFCEVFMILCSTVLSAVEHFPYKTVMQYVNMLSTLQWQKDFINLAEVGFTQGSEEVNSLLGLFDQSSPIDSTSSMSS